MVDPVAASRLGHRALFVGLAALILFVRLLPLSTLPARWPGPDMLLCLTVVWVLRRPDYSPALVIAAIFLTEDLLTLRPPGLWAMIVLMGTEFLRRRETGTRDLPFLAEWGMAAATMAAMMLVYRLAFVVFVIPQGSFVQSLVELIATAITYPVLAVLMQFSFGLRRAATGEVDALGHRL